MANKKSKQGKQNKKSKEAKEKGKLDCYGVNPYGKGKLSTPVYFDVPCKRDKLGYKI